MSFPSDHPVRADLASMSASGATWLPYAMKILDSDAIVAGQSYTLSDLAAAIGAAETEGPLFIAAGFLASCAHAVFDAGLCLKDGDRIIPLPAADVQRVLSKLPIAHPETGVMLAEPASVAYPLFSAPSPSQPEDDDPTSVAPCR